MPPSHNTDSRTATTAATLIVYCQTCGTEFTASGPNAKRCPTCAPVYEKVREFCKYRNQRLGVPHPAIAATEETVAAMREAVAKGHPADYAMTIVRSRPASAPASGSASRPCPYCGRPVFGIEEYCRKCVSEGLDNLHRVTGRSNGWDRPAPPKPRRPVRRQSGFQPVSIAAQRAARRKTA